MWKRTPKGVRFHIARLLFVRTLTQTTTAPCCIAKGLHNFNGINMTTIGTVNLFPNLWLNVGTAPPFVTAIAMKVIEKFERNFHRLCCASR